MERHSRWQRYIDSAVSRTPGTVETPGGGQPRRRPRHDAGRQGRWPWLRHRLASFALLQRATPAREEKLRRMDVRLVPSALLVWAAAAAGHYLHPAPLAALCLALVAAASGLLLLRAPPGVEPGGTARGGPGGRGGRAGGGRAAGGRAGGASRRFTGRARRNFPATLAVALILGAAAGGHAAVDTSRRHDGAVAGYVAAQADVAVEVEITGAPRRLRTVGRSGLADRWAVPANLIEMHVDGRRVRAQATLLVMGGAGWDHAAPGQRLRTTGKLAAPEPGQAEAAVLSASSAPLMLSAAGPSQTGPAGLRQHFTAAAGRFDGDARGLLPGMVTGDTSSLDAELDAAMKTVGMTHLTAVSGANCSLILGVLLVAARSLRFSRAFAAVLCLAGLGLFVLMVGPDASVLRAAVMGGIGLVALAGGRPGRGLSFLCLAVIGLVLAQPALSTSFGFLLSVLATLGIVVSGQADHDLVPGSRAALVRRGDSGAAVRTGFLRARDCPAAAAVLRLRAARQYGRRRPRGPGHRAGDRRRAVGAAGPGPRRRTAGHRGGLRHRRWEQSRASSPDCPAPSCRGRKAHSAPPRWPSSPPAHSPPGGCSSTRPARPRWPWRRMDGRWCGSTADCAAATARRRRRPGPRPAWCTARAVAGLESANQSSGRKPQWLLPRPHAPGPPRRTPPPGAT